MTENLYIIDGHSQIFRAYYSPAARRRTVRGKPVGAIYIFTRMLQKLIKDYKPDYLVCVLDPHGPTFRSEIYPEYKANRGEMPEDLRDQIPVIIDMLKAFEIPILQVDNFEADDVIASLAKHEAAKDHDVKLVTRDKDLKQLLDPHIVMLNTDKDDEYTAKDLHEDLGVTPEQFIDVQALAGDSVDNIPGAKGIGIKTAAQLIREYGSLEEVLKNAENIKQPKRRENLIAFRDQAELSKQLVTIRADVDVDFDKKAAKYHVPKQDKLLPLLMELNFKSVMKDFGWEADTGAAPEGAGGRKQASKKGSQGSLFGDVPKPDTPEASTAVIKAGEDYTLVDTEKALAAFNKATARSSKLALHCAAENYEDLAGIAVAVKPGKAWYFPLNGEAEFRTAVLETLKPRLEDEKVAKVGHDLKHDLRLLLHEDIHLRGIDSDTKLVAFLLDGSREDARLASLSREYLGMDTIDWDKLFGEKKKRKPLIEAEPQAVMQYAAQFADYALRVNDTLRPQLKERNLEKLGQDLEFPLIEVLGEMEHRGIRIDLPYLKKLEKEMARQIEKLAGECHKLAGREFTIGSPKQLGEVLFDELELPVQGRTAKGKSRSTDQGTLETLSTMHELPAKVLEWRHLSKLKSTYVDALPALADEEARVHTTYRQTVATGRLSSKDPNLQNIPVRTDEGKKIRRAFIAREGMKIIAADYSQIELRILAHITGEKNMIDAFKKGVDIHSATAAGIFGVKPDDVTGEQRNVAKTVNYGVLYGQSAYGLSQGLGISRGEAKEFIDNYFEAHPKVRGLTDQVLKDCREKGYVETLSGRKRYLPEIGSRNVMVRKQAERQAFNTVLQGTAADLVKLAMLNAHREIEKDGLPYRMLLQVHDELVFEAPEGDAKKCAEFARKVMGEAMKLKVPLDVDTGIGDNWLEAK